MCETPKASSPGSGPQLLSVDEAAKTLSLSVRATWALIGTSELKSLTIGRRRLIDVRDIERFIQTRKEDSHAGA